MTHPLLPPLQVKLWFSILNKTTKPACQSGSSLVSLFPPPQDSTCSCAAAQGLEHSSRVRSVTAWHPLLFGKLLGFGLCRESGWCSPRSAKAAWTCTPQERFPARPGLCHPHRTMPGSLLLCSGRTLAVCSYPGFFECSFVLFCLAQWLGVTEVETQQEDNPEHGYCSKQRRWSLSKPRLALPPKGSLSLGEEEGWGTIFELTGVGQNSSSTWYSLCWHTYPCLCYSLSLLRPLLSKTLFFYVWECSHITVRFIHSLEPVGLLFAFSLISYSTESEWRASVAFILRIQLASLSSSSLTSPFIAYCNPFSFFLCCSL